VAAIEMWRTAVIEERDEWQHQVDKLRKAYNEALHEHNSTRRLEFYFQPKSGRYWYFHSRSFSTNICHLFTFRPATTILPPSLPVLPPQPFRPIIKEICANAFGAFSGFGRHTANDFLFLHAIFPGMPAYLLCENKEVFEHFSFQIYAYLKSFNTNKFYARIVSVTNSDNPFAFNEESNEQYMKHHILVFRRVKAKVDRQLYIRYCELGYLDPDHTMGMSTILLSPSTNNSLKGLEYPSEKANAITEDVKQWRWLRVYLYEGFNAYSIIKARCPPSWSGQFFPLVKVLDPILH
jgi:hypothetical protein